MSRLFDYFTSPRVDSEGQLRAAQARARQFTPQQDAEARAHGFKNADEMVLFLKNRSVGAHQTTHVPANSGVTSDLSLANLLPWHPANTIGIASDALAQANNR